MNPVGKNNNKIRWKFENLETLKKNGGFSEEFTTDDLKWKIKLETKLVNGIKYLGVYLHHVTEKSSWIIESSARIKVSNRKQLRTGNFNCGLHTKNIPAWGFPEFLQWSFLAPNHYYDSRIEWITVECEFSYKFYDFSKNSAIFSDASIKVGTDEFYISKGYISTFSKFFNEKFVNKNLTKVTITGVKSDDFVRLLAAILPDPIQISFRNYDAIMDLSEKFEIDSLIKKCEEYFKKNKCIEIIRQIKEAEKFNYRTQIPTLLATLKRGKELKIISEDENFKNFKDSTKVAIMNAAFKFL
ncbi:unnamed protein product [Caenorhabditis angaria]|uniref:BTB domain-containing protein n=1 Tax=Caenorhabditis angaria TaxID=860376 RepID=A0A9P1IKI9_9PELO|nr:unnamed protein product [Caenorhabditis angaria]